MYVHGAKIHSGVEENECVSMDLHCTTLILILPVFSIWK